MELSGLHHIWECNVGGWGCYLSHWFAFGHNEASYSAQCLAMTLPNLRLSKTVQVSCPNDLPAPSKAKQDLEVLVLVN